MNKLAALMGLAIIGSAHAVPAAAETVPSFLTFGERADPPVGFLEFCERDPVACGIDEGSLPAAAPCAREAAFAPERSCMRGDDAPLATAAIGTPRIGPADEDAQAVHPGGSDVSAADGKLVRSINSSVNSAVIQTTDRDLFGVPEYWQRSGREEGAAGDCEDIALQKQAELIAAGFPPDSLFLAVVYKSGVGLHTVLIARLSQGDMVLDSLTSRLHRWDESGFSWVRLQMPDNPLLWTRPANS